MIENGEENYHLHHHSILLLYLFHLKENLVTVEMEEFSVPRFYLALAVTIIIGVTRAVVEALRWSIQMSNMIVN